MVHVAHNVIIGKHTAVIANAMIGGGTKIGEFTWIAPSVCLRDRIKIGAKSTVGLASVVTKDITDDVTVMGSPAHEVTEQKNF